MENTKNMTVKIGLIDYISINQLQLFLLKNRKMKLSKKALLGWIIQKAKNKLMKK